MMQSSVGIIFPLPWHRSVLGLGLSVTSMFSRIKRILYYLRRSRPRLLFPRLRSKPLFPVRCQWQELFEGSSLYTSFVPRCRSQGRVFTPGGCAACWAESYLRNTSVYCRSFLHLPIFRKGFFRRFLSW